MASETTNIYGQPVSYYDSRLGMSRIDSPTMNVDYTPPMGPPPVAGPNIALWNQPSPYDDLFNQVAPQYGMDPQLLRAMAFQESRFDPNAVSPAGAQGLMQFTPITQQHLAQQGYPFDPFNPQQSVEAGARYFQELQGRFEDPNLALAAYNMGPTALSKQLQQGQLNLPDETSQYVSSINSMVGQPDPFSGQRANLPPTMQQPQQPMMQPQMPQQPQPQMQPQMQQPPMQPQMGAGMQQPQQPQNIRELAQQDPGYFYSILAQASQMNPQGIQALMQQRQAAQVQQQQFGAEQQLEREKIDAQRGVKQESTDQRKEFADQRYVDQVRNKLRASGHLEEYERQGGVVSTREQAQQAESWSSGQIAEEKLQEDKAKSLIQFSKNPTAARSLTSKYQRWYDQDPSYRETIDFIRERAEDREEERVARNEFNKERRKQLVTLGNQAVKRGDVSSYEFNLYFSRYQRQQSRLEDLEKQIQDMEMRAHFLGEDSIAGQQLNDLIQRYEKTTQEMEDTEMRIFEMLGKTGGDEGTGEGGDTSKPPKTQRLSLSDLMPEEDTKSPTSTPTSESIRKKLTGK